MQEVSGYLGMDNTLGLRKHGLALLSAVFALKQLSWTHAAIRENRYAFRMLAEWCMLLHW